MSDVLRMDYINSLPQPFLVRFYGDKIWWPVNDFDVGTGLLRIDVCGMLQVKHFEEIAEIRDGDGQAHEPDSFYNEDGTPQRSPQEEGTVMSTPEIRARAFEWFVGEIQKLAESCGAADPGKPYCDAESWRDSFDDGMTPDEAWHEECLAAAEMLG